MARKLKGVTLLELLILVVLISLIFLIIFGSNFFSQIKKARDAKRKDSVIKIQKVIEDFHLDHGRYPSVSEMAYELVDDIPQNWDTALAGKVCGKERTSEIINQYIGELPCDTSSPDSDFVYFLFDNNQRYAIFTTLELTSDPVIEEIGCTYGCSYFRDVRDPSGSISSNYFNYYVASSDFSISDCYSGTVYHACYPGRENPNDRCKICTDYSCEPGYATLYCNANWCLQNCLE